VPLAALNRSPLFVSKTTAAIRVEYTTADIGKISYRPSLAYESAQNWLGKRRPILVVKIALLWATGPSP